MKNYEKTEMITLKGFKITKLTATNYHSWASELEAFLWANGWWKNVDPSDEYRRSMMDQFTEAWIEGRTAFQMLKVTITDDIWQELTRFTTAESVWLDLKMIYESKAAANQSLIQQKLDAVSLEAKESIQDYINRITRLTTELRQNGGTLTPVMYTGYLIRGLPSTEWSTLKTICNTYREHPERVKALLLGEEAARQEETVRDNSVKSHALRASRNQSGTNKDGNNSFGKTCYRCGRKGHVRMKCIAKSHVEGKEMDPITAKTSSTTPANEKQKTLNYMVKRNYNARTPIRTEISTLQETWYFDSGASEHVTGNRGSLTSISSIPSIFVTLGNGQDVEVTEVGKAIISTGGRTLVLSRVLYNSNFGASLISINQLTARGAEILFSGDQCSMYEGSTEVLSGILVPKLGLYRLGKANAQVYKASVSERQELELMHKRFCHINYDYVSKSKEHVRGMEHITTTVHSPCTEVCSLGKAHRAHMASDIDEKRQGVLHVDIWGPARVPSWQGNKYAFTCVGSEGGMGQISAMPDRKGFNSHLVPISPNMKS